MVVAMLLVFGFGRALIEAMGVARCQRHAAGRRDQKGSGWFSRGFFLLIWLAMLGGIIAGVVWIGRIQHRIYRGWE